MSANQVLSAFPLLFGIIVGALLFGIAIIQNATDGDSQRKKSFRLAATLSLGFMAIFSFALFGYAIASATMASELLSQAFAIGGVSSIAFLVIFWVKIEWTAYGDDLPVNEVIELMQQGQIELAYFKMKAEPGKRHLAKDLYGPIYDFISLPTGLAKLAAHYFLGSTEQTSPYSVGGEKIIEIIERLIPTQEEFTKRLLLEACEGRLLAYDTENDEATPLSPHELKKHLSIKEPYFQIGEAGWWRKLINGVRVLLPGRGTVRALPPPNH